MLKIQLHIIFHWLITEADGKIFNHYVMLKSIVPATETV